jgi:hypothetical protein
VAQLTESNADVVWNRACSIEPSGSDHPGDVALASMIVMHSLIMNGGLHHALGALNQAEIAAALSGYRYFDLVRVADAISSIQDTAGLAIWTDSNEEEANRVYEKLVPDDSHLMNAFKSRYIRQPEDFEPVS